MQFVGRNLILLTLFCGCAGSLPFRKARSPIAMVQNKIEENEEEFDARRAAISSEATNAYKPQACRVVSS